MKSLLPFIFFCGCLGAGVARSAEPAPGKPSPSGGGWGEIFKIHWKNRVRAHQEQNLAWKNVVLLGDSITEGFDVAKHFPGRRVLNRGIGADVIGNAMPADDPRGVLQRLDSSVYDCAATDVFILIGINDLNSGRGVDAMVEGCRELLSRSCNGNEHLRQTSGASHESRSSAPPRTDNCHDHARVFSFADRPNH